MKLRLNRLIVSLALFFLSTGCFTEPINPDDGLRFKLELDDLSLSQLKQFKYKELVESSGALAKHIQDTIIVYEYDKGNFVRRHAMFKYHGDTTQSGFGELFKRKGFAILGVKTSAKQKIYIVRDLKYDKKYYVTLSRLRYVEFSYPDLIPDDE